MASSNYAICQFNTINILFQFPVEASSLLHIVKTVIFLVVIRKSLITRLIEK